ncbi:acyltransferase family protein [Uliginosibacterium aquaticum]|uniref:Acyltransferase n=1 Tax=Uliginosibacterium aquaticum TaxID=2731212 RepID=A0ABX2IHC4_9RHOO|nr:acyltransferase [Uliginosibacterium aquaticum]NSL54039.1 acyltransferase [Uliginosibacterium aquaticum]
MTEIVQKNDRRLEVDTLRGLACLLLVFYHVVGSSAASGLHVEKGVLREFNDLLVHVRMPIFTVLSGFVYGARPFSGGFFEFLVGKAKRLLVPMLFVGTFFALIQSFVPGSNHRVESWLLLHVIPYAHFWFVESLFLIFVVVAVLEYWQKITDGRSFFFVLLIAVLLMLSGAGFEYFSVKGAVYLFPYFMFGLLLKRFALLDGVGRAAGVCVLAVVFVCMLVWGERIGTDRQSVASLVVAVSSVSALYAMRLKFYWLAWVGVRSYSIYLYHVFFAAGARILSASMEVDSLGAMVVLGVVCGVLGPILVEHLVPDYSFSRRLFLGASVKRDRAK